MVTTQTSAKEEAADSLVVNEIILRVRLFGYEVICVAEDLL